MNAKQTKTHVETNSNGSLIIERSKLLYNFSIVEFNY
jgi:hypothetical protein